MSALNKSPISAGKVSPARAAAFRILERMEADAGAHSDDLLHGQLLAGLTELDQNLATALVMGVLRWQITLDARIDRMLDQPEKGLPVPVRLALRLGAYQLLYMDRIPAHAALSESVELVRVAGHPGAAGIVNALLRRVTREEKDRVPMVEPVAAMATRLGHPGWMVERWVKQFGRPAATAICEYDQSEPPTGELFAVEEGVPAIDDGSRLVAELAAVAVPAARRIWDACAAPGGKTMVLAARHADAEVLATDVSARRLKAMVNRLRREAPAARIRAVEADAARLPAAEGEFDLVLADAPCSGTGTLGRNPEIRHRLRATELGLQAKRQREILAAALGRIAPGGRVVYSTCSLEPEENEQVVEEVLRRNEGFELVAAEPLLGLLVERGVMRAASGLTRGPYLRTIPGSFAGDGFFAAVIERS